MVVIEQVETPEMLKTRTAERARQGLKRVSSWQLLQSLGSFHCI